MTYTAKCKKHAQNAAEAIRQMDAIPGPAPEIRVRNSEMVEIMDSLRHILDGKPGVAPKRTDQ